jgi:arylformamidase
MYELLFVIFCAVFAAAAIVLYKYSAFFTWHVQKYRVKQISDVPYAASGTHPRQRLDVYLPKTVQKFPVVHFIYGGYWTSGSKRYKQRFTGLYGNIGVSLARRGIGVVVSDYRLSPEVNIEGQIDDVAAAIKWTAGHVKQWGGNGQIYAMGHSAGGHLVSLLAADTALLRSHEITAGMINGCVALSPVLDIQALVKSHDVGFNRRISFPVFGSTPRQWHKYSPLDHMLARPNKSMRLMIIVGENDFEHIRTTALAAHKKITKAGVPATLHIIPGYNHTALVTRFGQRSDSVIKLVLDFMKSQTS